MTAPASAPVSTLALLAGVSGSGKTTFARTLVARGFVRLSIDEVVWARGGDWAMLAAGVEDELRGRLVALLRQGRDVVLDYPCASATSGNATASWGAPRGRR